MSAVERLVERLLSLWRLPGLRSLLAAGLLLLSALGSAAKELLLVPDTYFSSSGNALNLYFVKLSWGWTLLLLVPFLLLSASSLGGGVSYLCRRLSALAVATAIWYVCTQSFVYIEDATGRCYRSRSSAVEEAALSSRAACRGRGFHWAGYDISGHSFILAYASLLMAEEMAVMAAARWAGPPGAVRTLLGLLYLLLHLLLLLWLWMFCCTSFYFHQPSHKLLGTGCGLAAWYATYRLWYRTPLSPGLPPQSLAKEEHRHT